MKIPDVNILIYAHDQSSPFHQKSHAWLKEALADPTERVGIATAVALAFIRLTCNPKAMASPLTIAEAGKAVNSWFSAGAIHIDADAAHFEDLARMIQEVHGGLNLLIDAHLAALAMRHKGTIYSNDRDFLRFKGIKIKNPIDP